MVSGVYWSAEIFLCTSLCVYAWFWGHVTVCRWICSCLYLFPNMTRNLMITDFFLKLFHTLLILPLRFKVIHPIIMLCFFLFFIISCWIEKVHLINYNFTLNGSSVRSNLFVEFVLKMFKHAHHEFLLHILKIHCCDILYFYCLQIPEKCQNLQLIYPSSEHFLYSQSLTHCSLLLHLTSIVPDNIWGCKRVNSNIKRVNIL